MSDALEGIFDPSSLNEISEDAKKFSQYFRFYSLCREDSKISFFAPKSICGDLITKSWSEDQNFDICFFGKNFSVSLDSLKIIAVEGDAENFLITTRILDCEEKDT